MNGFLLGYVLGMNNQNPHPISFTEVIISISILVVAMVLLHWR